MKETSDINLFFEEYRCKINHLFEHVDINILNKIIEVLIQGFKDNKTVYICGNGGSAATASHMQVDFSFYIRKFTSFRPRVRALTDNIPVITAVSNDMSYNDIFIEQLRGNIEEGDILICFSASGNSENVIRAARYVNEKGGKSISMVGFSGGELRKVTQLSLFTPCKTGDYGPVEDIHIIFIHIIINYLVTDNRFLTISE